jgi:hypothetical protein
MAGQDRRIVVEFANFTLFFARLCWLRVQIMGGATPLVAQAGFLNNAVVPTLTGALVDVVVSAMTPRTTPGFEDVANLLHREREGVEAEWVVLDMA